MAQNNSGSYHIYYKLLLVRAIWQLIKVTKKILVKIYIYRELIVIKHAKEFELVGKHNIYSYHSMIKNKLNIHSSVFDLLTTFSIVHHITHAWMSMRE